MQTRPLLGMKVITIDKETTSTAPKNGEEVNKDTGHSETKKDSKESKNEQPLDELLGIPEFPHLKRRGTPFETTFNQDAKDNPLLSMGYTDKGATALRIWGYTTRGVYMLGKPEYTQGKGQDKEIRLEDSRQFERTGIQDVRSRSWSQEVV